MTGDDTREVELFSEIIDLPTEERIPFLDRVCGGDEDLRGRIERLLRLHDRAGNYLESPPTEWITKVRAKVSSGEKPGDRIDRYKLLAQIGEGGCGVVFVAEQAEPVRRHVALKVIKPGMDSKNVIARFEAERQALALMDHPNISHVFDAGATQSGRPYFVMELVEGVKITDYCDRDSLPTSARLDLFVQICDAIQHAHQKGIIHRDIKPSNILVTKGSDGKSTPKVIDFGIAKAIAGQQLTDKTIFTAFEMLIGTPAYMSPEQAALTSTDVDTRTDIYSLGVLLYELLTGKTPFDTPELLKAGFDEVRRVIREEEPVRPSTRLTTMVASEFAKVSQNHGAEGTKLIREMRGDLDWIVMKALEKDRARRYATANGLAQDIKRYLLGEAVLARPPSHLYKFQKLVSRHKLAFAGFGIVMGTLVAALFITTRSLARERAEAVRNRQTYEFVSDMLKSVNPMTWNERNGATAFREMIDNAADLVGTKFTNQPLVQADLRLLMGKIYGKYGLMEKGEPLVRDAMEFYQKSKGAERIVANARFALSELYSQQGKSAQAQEEAREALKIQMKLTGEENLDVLRMEIMLARQDVRLGKPAEAELKLRKAVAKTTRLFGAWPPELIEPKSVLVFALENQGRFTEAEKEARDCVSLAREKCRTNVGLVALNDSLLARLLVDERKFTEAEDLSREAVASMRATLPPAHPWLDSAILYWGLALRGQGKNTQAADVYRELLEIRRKRYGEGDERVMAIANTLLKMLVPDLNADKLAHLAGEIPEALILISESLARNGRWPEARAAAIRFLEKQPGNPNGYHLMAPLLAQAGDRAAYEELCAKITSRFAGATDPYIADRMAKDCLILPRPAADLKVPGELAETAVTVGRSDSWSLPYFQCCKALAELRRAHHEGAVTMAQLAAKGTNPHAQAEAAAIMAMAQFKLNQLDKARTALADCNKIIGEKLPKSDRGDLGDDWRDWIVAHALQSEAKQMIDGQTSSPGDHAN